ncbi:MAG: hypothetical protein HQL89_12815 [Magnetococcales bacterium]|nr:hypothetical protein [Magnetococcales bacterium]
MTKYPINQSIDPGFMIANVADGHRYRPSTDCAGRPLSESESFFTGKFLLFCSIDQEMILDDGMFLSGHHYLWFGLTPMNQTQSSTDIDFTIGSQFETSLFLDFPRGISCV